MKRRAFVRGAAAAFTVVSGRARGQGNEPAARAAPILVGQIGTSHAHAAGKMQTMRKFPRLFEVAGIVEPDERRWEAVKEQEAFRGLVRMTEEQLFDVPDLRAVAVETRVRDLVPAALRCLRAGFHIHLDKPAGDSMQLCRELHDLAASKQLTVQMGYMLRYNPAFQLCYRAVDEGWLGDIFELHAVMSKTSGEEARRDMAEFSGGAMFELGCHIIDSAVRVLGKPDQVTPHLRRTKEGDDLYDNTLAVLEYPGATATIRSALVEYDGFRRRQFVVCGDHGTVDIKPLEPPAMLLGIDAAQGEFRPGYQEVELPDSTGRYDGEFQDFARIIHGEIEPPFSHAHDLAVHETVLRASGMPVD